MKNLPRPQTALELPHSLVALSSSRCPAQFPMLAPKTQLKRLLIFFIASLLWSPS